MLQIVSLVIVVVVSAILGLLTYYNNPKSATNKMMGLFSLTIIFWAVTMYLTLHPPAENQRLFLIRLSMLAAIAMSSAVLFLSHTVPSDKFKLSPVITGILSFLALCGMATAMSPYMFTHLDIQGSNIDPVPGPGILMFLLTGLGYSISGIFILLRKYKRSKGLQKQQLLFVLLGISLMHILLIIANFVIVLIFKSSYFISFGPLFTLFFLISVFYAISRHKFLEIRVVVVRAISFTLLIVATALVYTGILYGLVSLVPQSNQYMLNVGLTVLLAFSLNPVRRVIESATQKLFFRKGYQTHDILEELGNITTSTLAISTITNRVLLKLIKALQIDKAAFLLIDDNHPKIIEQGYDDPPTLSETHLRSLAQKAKSNPYTYEEVGQSEVKQLFKTIQASVILPIENSDRVYGILSLGQKKSGHIYTNQDIELLNIFIPQISVAIQNSLAYEKIRRFNQTLSSQVDIATTKLKSANRNLRHLDKLKDEFVYVATHELKNPVTAMKGYLSMITEGSFGKIPKNLAEPIEQLNLSNQQLVSLVNDLLNIARAEANTLKINSIAVNLCSIIEGVIQSVKPLAEQKHLNLEYQYGKKNISVMADPERLKEVFNNLISNAIKYSDQGTISITHVVDKNNLIIHVKDQGVGIATKDQSKIFTRFFRVAEEVSKGIPGSGLGLFIVRQLVEKMGGKIWFTSSLGKGSIFSFTLPKASKT